MTRILRHIPAHPISYRIGDSVEPGGGVSDPVAPGVVLLFVDRGSRPDVDNVLKHALDALKGIVYLDDRQVPSVREAAPNDDSLRTVNSTPHRTFATLLDGEHFLIRVRLPDVPTITRELASS